jgi:hypothetical protein
MSDFHKFATAVHARFNELQQGQLLAVGSAGLFEHYLASFPEGTNPIFRVNTEHHCSCCRNFIKHLGCLVVVQDGETKTVWQVDVPEPYQAVADAMDMWVRTAVINGFYYSKEPSYGTPSSLETLEDGTVHTWNHFHGKLASKFIKANPGEHMGAATSNFNVFKRGVTTIKPEAVATVIDLIKSNSLYRGAEKLAVVEAFQLLQAGYNNTDEYLWENTGKFGSRMRNDVIGTLVTAISDGTPLETAVARFEAMVAPANYKRTSAPISQSMVERAIETLDKLGYREATRRRYARIEDVSVNNVLFVDDSVRSTMQDSLEDLMSAAARPSRAAYSENVTAEDFFQNILPNAQSVEIFLDNTHLPNFVSLTAPESSVENMFKWNNNFAWSYDGDVTDGLRERAKKAGGNVDALFGVTLGWDYLDDLDIHCKTPSGHHISWQNRSRVLDVDRNSSRHNANREPVENMAFDRVEDGTYQFSVHNYSRRETDRSGFQIQMRFGSRTEHYAYSASVPNKKLIPVLKVAFKNRQIVSVVPAPGMAAENSPETKWNITTQQYVPVEAIMLSPNYWDGQSHGNKHHILMLKDCKNPGTTRGFYNEFLNSQLNEHRKVLEILAAKTACQPTDQQLSGVGFSSTRHDVIQLRVNDGNSTRPYKIQF